ncbi:putative murein peptide carboxypeptidase [Streptococcus constellatus]|uniref:Putative murein peptide carboxypeptidase n=1 Tax=Streptococcus constellatus TaxID=76860 RepID=A0A564TKK8_STRCV|nr:S66 peptidase family protein [Streptococcus constellatus]VUW97454.1 putative murein peptide carboxypeptidase [Streptococcus gordonii]VUX07769.1 putative murein peptide carboxypeptidase [Streptococcus constellatus]
MIKKVGIVSLSSGIIGENFVRHEVDLGLKRLKDLGLEVTFLEHAQKGMDYLEEHPESRAQDLIQAFEDSSIDMILCAIGGDDTYRLLPYLFEDDQLKKVVDQKVFLGFSDTTINHLMLHKLGMKTFYGQSFLADVCELEEEMLPYTLSYFKELIGTETISEIRPSSVWYDERMDFSEKALGMKRTRHENQGFELLKGKATFEGEILGGCLESLYQIFDNTRYEDTIELCARYALFSSLSEWAGKILLLETSEEKTEPTLYRKMLKALKATGIFAVLNGVLVGKPMDETYYDEYKQILLDVIDMDIPILYNLNVGHATPRAIVPFGVKAQVDANEQVIRFLNELK